ncbi:hypothetical protein ACGLHS_06415 [Variovorax sp. VaC1]|uniref:hypothetical protein n=1 Tax=Variovorax sp. VaC1 TaxID=3373132 RepID=UPI0037478CE2
MRFLLLEQQRSITSAARGTPPHAQCCHGSKARIDIRIASLAGCFFTANMLLAQQPCCLHTTEAFA